MDIGYRLVLSFDFDCEVSKARVVHCSSPSSKASPSAFSKRHRPFAFQETSRFLSFSLLSRMHILVRVALPAAAAAQRERGGVESSIDAPSTSSHSSSSLFAFDLAPFSSSSPPSSSLASVAERALREAGHPDARRALESGEWRAVFEAAGGALDAVPSPSSSSTSSSSSSLPLLSVAPAAFCLPGGKGGFGSLLRASGRVSKITDHGACRDLSGRRVKHVEQERAAAEWLAAAPARAEAEAAKKKAAEEARKKVREEVAREAEASVDAEALRRAQERAATETAAAVAEAEGKKRVVGGGGVGGAEEEEEEEKEQQPSSNGNSKSKKKKGKSALDALAGLSGDDDDSDDSDDSDDE